MSDKIDRFLLFILSFSTILLLYFIGFRFSMIITHEVGHVIGGKAVGVNPTAIHLNTTQPYTSYDHTHFSWFQKEVIYYSGGLFAALFFYICYYVLYRHYCDQDNLVIRGVSFLIQGACIACAIMSLFNGIIEGLLWERQFPSLFVDIWSTVGFSIGAFFTAYRIQPLFSSKIDPVETNTQQQQEVD